MSVKELNIIKRMQNAGDRSVDYYSNVCRNDGGTSAVSFMVSQEETAPGVNLSGFNTLIRHSQFSYRYVDFFDLLEYESQLATEELTSDPIIMQKITVGEQEIKEGKKISWREVYRAG